MKRARIRFVATGVLAALLPLSSHAASRVMRYSDTLDYRVDAVHNTSVSYTTFTKNGSGRVIKRLAYTLDCDTLGITYRNLATGKSSSTNVQSGTLSDVIYQGYCTSEASAPVAPASGRNWVLVATGNDGVKTFVDPASVTETTESLFWIKRTGMTVKLRGRVVRSAVIQQMVNCLDNTLTSGPAAYYDGTGSAVFGDNSWGDAQAIIPDSVADAVRDYVCTAET